MKNPKRKLELEDSEIEENYFVLDKNPLISFVSKSLRKKFPKLDEILLDKTLKNTFDKVETGFIEQYCEAIPNDKMSHMEQREVRKLKPLLKDLRQNIKVKTPTMSKIITSGLSQIEKEIAIQLYDVLNNTEPYTLEYMNLNMRLYEMINIPSKNRKSNHVIESNLNFIKSEMDFKIPTLDKIACAYLIKSDKIKAFQLYEILQQTGYNTDEWFNIQRQINCILDSQMNSLEEVTKFETELGKLQTKEKSLKQKIIELDTDLSTKTKIYEMYCDMMARSSSDSRYTDLKDKIAWALKLPFQKTSIISNDLNNLFQLLNHEVYGMQHAKERIIQAMNDRINNPNSRSILALSGDPGVGKTKIAFSIAKACGLPFDKISLGGMIDSTIFKGSDSVWRGAAPSMILQILARVKSSNVVILLDEVDKLSCSPKGLEVQHALLHILDPVQNKEFQDAYLNEFNHDISRIFFILAMNDESKLDSALKDRLNIINIPSYRNEEMIHIIHKHVLPNSLKDKGIEMDQVRITDDACKTLLMRLSIKKTGIRAIEFAISDIVSKLNLLQAFKKNGNLEHTWPLTFSVNDFKQFPYIITSDTIESLVKYPETTHRDMYL